MCNLWRWSAIEKLKYLTTLLYSVNYSYCNNGSKFFEVKKNAFSVACLQKNSWGCYSGLKYLHGIYRDDCSDLLPLHELSSLTTRGHSLKLEKRSNRTQLRQNYFSNRVVNMCNNLTQVVVIAPTVNCFKERVDRHSAENRYSMEWRYGPVSYTHLTLPTNREV